MIIKLPSNSNQILEEIDCYNTLSSLIETVSLDHDRFDSNWQSGLNSLKNHNRADAQRRSRRFLNLNEGGYRTFTFQLNLCNVLFHEQYIPLALLNGISVELYLATATEAFHYNPAIEQWNSVFGQVEGLYLTQEAYNGLDEQLREP